MGPAGAACLLTVVSVGRHRRSNDAPLTASAALRDVGLCVCVCDEYDGLSLCRQSRERDGPKGLEGRDSCMFSLCVCHCDQTGRQAGGSQWKHQGDCRVILLYHMHLLLTPDSLRTHVHMCGYALVHARSDRTHTSMTSLVHPQTHTRTHLNPPRG